MKLKLSEGLFNASFLPYLYDYANRIEIYYGGAGSGKSHFLAQKLIIKALQNSRRVLVIRKTLASMRESCWRLICDILAEWRIYNYCAVNKSDFTISLPNGSQFIFKGLDDPEKIKSIEGISDLWIEEATELTNADEFDQLTLRIRARTPFNQIYLSYNPVSRANWVYLRFHASAYPGAVVHKSTYKDNRFLTADYVAKLEALIKTNPLYYRVYALGEFCSLDKTVFTNWTIEERQQFNYNVAIFGLDFGYINDPSAFVAAKVNTAEKEIYIFDELYQVGLLNDSIARWIKYKGYGKETIYADAAEQKSIDEIKRNGVDHIKPAVKGQGSIMWGIDLLQQYRIIVSPTCENMITELQNYSWKKDKKTGEYINEPADEYNHLCDALRYAMQRIYKPGLRTMPKSVLGL